MTSVPLKELAAPSGLVGGPFGSSLVSADYRDAGVPVIRGENLNAGKWVGGSFAYVSEEKVRADLARNTARAGDIVFTQRGTLGQVAIVPGGAADELVVSQSQMRLRVDRSKALPEFVYYACSEAKFLQQISDRAIATGVPHINLGILASLEVPLPPLPTQRAIAEVLGALDDKIAANGKVSDSAQRLAEAVYSRSSCAVRRVPASEVLTPVLGGTPDRSNGAYWEGEVPWVSAKDITAAKMGIILHTEESISAEAVSRSRAKPVPAGSVILTARGTVGAVARLAVKATFNQSCYAFVPSPELPPGCLYFMVRDTAANALSVAHGSVFSTITMRSFDALTVPALGAPDLYRLEDDLAPLLDSIAARAVESSRLAELRDTLLPHLMSGRISVREAEKAVEEML